MNELVSLIVKKTGVPENVAQTIVNLVIDYIKKKVPAVGPEIDMLLNNEGNIKAAEDMLGGLLGKKK